MPSMIMMLSNWDFVKVAIHSRVAFNLKYLHISNMQVLLVILIRKSRFYSRKCGCDVFLKVACVAGAILRKSALKFITGAICSMT